VSTTDGDRRRPQRALLALPLAALVVAVTVGAVLALRDDGEETATTTGARPAGFLSRAELGDRWPFAVEEGVLRCQGNRALTFEAGGRTYALNATSEFEKLGEPVTEIWGGVKELDPVLDRALALCRE